MPYNAILANPGGILDSFVYHFIVFAHDFDEYSIRPDPFLEAYSALRTLIFLPRNSSAPQPPPRAGDHAPGSEGQITAPGDLALLLLTAFTDSPIMP